MGGRATRPAAAGDGGRRHRRIRGGVAAVPERVVLILNRRCRGGRLIIW